MTEQKTKTESLSNLKVRLENSEKLSKMCCRRTTCFMIFALIGLVIGLLFPIPSFTRSIEEELKDFCSIMPIDKMREIAEKHIKTDEEFNEAIIYFQSDTWSALVNNVKMNPEWIKLKTFLNKIGLNLDVIFNNLSAFVDELKPVPNKIKTNKSLDSFFYDVDGILPIGKLLTLLHEKKQHSMIFKKFYAEMSSHEVHSMFENVRRQTVVKEVLKELESMGFRIDEILKLFYGFMNWNAASLRIKRETKERKLEEDSKDLIPMKNVTDRYLNMSEIALFLQGPEFKKIIENMKKQKEYIELRDFFNESGLDIEKVSKVFLDLILIDQSMNHTEAENATTEEDQKNFENSSAEIEGVLSVDELLTKCNKTTDHDGKFETLMGKLRDQSVKKMVNDLRQLAETKELLNKLQSFGVKINETIIILYAFLGWGSPF